MFFGFVEGDFAGMVCLQQAGFSEHFIGNDEGL
jgi:hypothetical protein